MGFKLKYYMHIYVQEQLPRLQMLMYKLLQDNAF